MLKLCNMMRSMKMIAMMRKMDTMMEADPRDKSSTKTRCNMLPNINSLCMLKKRSNEESMLCTVLSSLLTPDQARKIALITPSKTASESANLASSTSAATARSNPRRMPVDVLIGC